ncbi:MAG: PRC-barrel domain-containing protein [Candidatus Nitrotoga sp. SPKER]|nr:MAG: PRC-barrel domain-containing protein [Candidatus Nitrotoga sp. SPKER]
MSYQDNDIYEINKKIVGEPGSQLMGINILIGNDVYNQIEEDLGDIKEIMLDMESGKVVYAVLSYGGILGIGEKLFAVPWGALTLDTTNKRFILNVKKDQLENASGFDKDNWPDVADPSWKNEI